MQIPRKVSLKAGGASHPSRTFGKSLQVIVSPSLDDDSRNFYDITSTISPEVYRQSLVRRPVFSLVRLLVRPWPYRVAPAAGESFGAHIRPIPCSLCHLMYTHTIMVLQQMSQHSQHLSTARILVPSGPFGLAEQGLLRIWTLLPLPKFFRQGGSAWNLLDFYN